MQDNLPDSDENRFDQMSRENSKYKFSLINHNTLNKNDMSLL